MKFFDVVSKKSTLKVVICITFQHTTTVNQISIDDNGDYLASCSDDGRVSCAAFSFFSSVTVACTLQQCPVFKKV